MSLNRPFKAVLSEQWENYLFDTVSERWSDPEFNITPPTRQQIVDWLFEVYIYLCNRKEMNQKSFHICGVTTDPALVRNVTFYKSIMEKVRDELYDFDIEMSGDDPFEEMDIVCPFEI